LEEPETIRRGEQVDSELGQTFLDIYFYCALINLLSSFREIYENLSSFS
jgi:hypothetical protein